MAIEPFLVNPPRRLRLRTAPKRRSVSTAARRRHMAYVRSFKKKTVPKRATKGRSVKVMRRKTAVKRRKKNFWKEAKTMSVARRVAPRHRRAALKGRKKRRRNPAPLVIAGANPPRRRRRRYNVARRRKRTYARRRSNPIHRRRKSYARRYRRNVRRYTRHYRRNPAASLTLFGFNFPHWIKQSVTVGLGIGAANITPGLAAPYVGNSAMAKVGVQTGTAIFGGMLVAKVAKSKELGVLFAAGVGGVIAWDLLSTYVFKGMFGLSDYHLSGYSLGEYYPGGTQTPDGGMMNAFPDVSYDETLGAFPDTVLQY